MKAILLILSFFLPLLSSASPFSRKEKILLSCVTQKWTSVELLQVTDRNETNQIFYVLQVTKTNRDRQSVGVHTESVSPIFFTENAQHTVMRKKPDGAFELIAEFVGTQPLNVSAVKLVGEPDGERGLKLSLEPGKPSIQRKDAKETQNAYDFFQNRWNQLLTSQDVLENPEALTNCSWENN